MNSSTSFLKEYNTGSIKVNQDSEKNASGTSITWVAGSSANGISLGSAFQSSGLSGFNTRVNHPDWQFSEGSEFTLSCWVNIISYNTTSAGQLHGVFGKGSFNTCNYGINIMSGTTPGFTVGARSGTTIIGGQPATPNLALNAWHHIVGQYAAGSFQIFYNNTAGSQISAGGSAFNGGLGSVSMGRTGGYLGGNEGSEVITQIDECRIYNRALTTGEIGSLYNGLNVTNGLVGYWKFNEGSGTIAYDSSDGIFGHYTTESINGVIQSIGFDNDTNFETGSLWVRVSGTGEQLLVRTSGLTNFTTYPFRYGTNVNGNSGSPWTRMNYVVDGPLLIIGSDIGEATTIKNISIKYV